MLVPIRANFAAQQQQQTRRFQSSKQQAKPKSARAPTSSYKIEGPFIEAPSQNKIEAAYNWQTAPVIGAWLSVFA